MDRDAFNNLDKHFQEELNAAEQKLRVEIEEEYLKYEGNYTGSLEMQAKARAEVDKQKESAFQERKDDLASILEQAHFHEFGGRDSALEQMNEWELEQDQRAKEEAAYEKRLDEHFEEQDSLDLDDDDLSL